MTDALDGYITLMEALCAAVPVQLGDLLPGDQQAITFALRDVIFRLRIAAHKQAEHAAASQAALDIIQGKR